MIKKSFLWLHKWLGLITGIVVFLVSITGCIYVFHDDLKLLFYADKYFTHSRPSADKIPLPLSKLIPLAQEQLDKGEVISRVDLYPASNRTWVFRALKINEEAFGYRNYHIYNKRVFINPYSGEVQAVENTKYEFFQVVLQMHMNLLLGKKVGHPVVGYSTVIFAVLLITGLVLWWPKKWTKRSVKQSFSLDLRLSWKRINYDLHNVLGFYNLLFALIICITGLVFSFPAFKTYYIESLNKLSTETVKMKDDFEPVPQKFESSLDNALSFALHKHPNADMMSIRLRDSTEEFHDIQIRMFKDRTGKFKWYYFNQSDGQVSKVKSSEFGKTGDKLAGLNFDLHVGSIGGYPTKILAFIASLICASLPITGTLVWWNKRKPKGKSRVKKGISIPARRISS
ncbi:PepSY-associated TM helix domain-containing protein [Leadbetterella byssophila]|uniref:PepSY-associated TM helix domain-containing protein n=1 Tax=Leadbetterella byssophila TaxID=316068 RepID=UPI0039A0B8E8